MKYNIAAWFMLLASIISLWINKELLSIAFILWGIFYMLECISQQIKEGNQ